MMNSIKPFDLSGVNFKVPIDENTDKYEAETRKCFYNFQMDILKKTANMLESDDHFEEEHSVQTYMYGDSSV